MAPHAARTQRLLTAARVRAAGWWTTFAGVALGGVLMGVMLLTYALCQGLVGTGPALVLAWVGAGVAALLGYDWLSLGPLNRSLRTELRAKLEALGELDFDPEQAEVYYVGLAHPARTSPWRVETDDDIGFVRLTFDQLIYRGDQLSFEVDLDDLVGVELEHAGYGLPDAFKRLRLTFADGEPFDAVLLSGREGDRLTTGNRATLVLHEALTKRLARRRRRRLSGTDTEAGLLTLRT